MTPRFLADADFKSAILGGEKRRELSLDFLTAQAARLEGVPDPEVLAIAEREGRILVSHDHRTMPRHFADFLRENQSPGVFLISQDLPLARPLRPYSWFGLPRTLRNGEIN